MISVVSTKKRIQFLKLKPVYVYIVKSTKFSLNMDYLYLFNGSGSYLIYNDIIVGL